MDKGPEELIVIILKGSTLDEEVFEYCTVQHVERLAFLINVMLSVLNNYST